MTNFATSFYRPDIPPRPTFPHPQFIMSITDEQGWKDWIKIVNKTHQMNELAQELHDQIASIPSNSKEINGSPILSLGDVDENGNPIPEKPKRKYTKRKPKATKQSEQQISDTPSLTDYMDIPQTSEEEDKRREEEQEREEEERKKRQEKWEEEEKKRKEKNEKKKKPKGYYADYNLGHEYIEKYFDKYVAYLLNNVQTPIRTDLTKGGKKPISDRDILITLICHVNTGRVVRDNKAYFKSLYEKGLVNRPLSKTSVWKYLANPNYTEILRAVVSMSGCPMISADEKLAIDSTGFRTTRYGEYCIDKHVRKIDQLTKRKKEGKANIKTREEVELEEKRRKEYLKFHIIVGTESHAISSAQVTESKGKGTGDSTLFRVLLPETVRLIGGHYIIGDGAYCKDVNFDTAQKLGCTLIAPFPVNARPEKHNDCVGYRRLYLMKENEPERFAKLYHPRSIVESVNSSIKRTMGESLNSRKHVAQVNELYIKAIIYNIRTLIVYTALNKIQLNFDFVEDLKAYHEEEERYELEKATRTEEKEKYYPRGLDGWTKGELEGLKFYDDKVEEQGK